MNKLVVTLFALVTAVASKNIEVQNVNNLENNIVYGYHTKYGIPLANQIREAETQSQASRITGGFVAFDLRRFPYQAGLIIDLPRGQSICGGSILSNWRVLTAAHCWFDGLSQAVRFTVVAGSETLFFGGQRLQTSNVSMHANWNPSRLRNDLAMINLNSPFSFSDIVAAVALPSGDEINSSFFYSVAAASGFGRTSDTDNITQSQFLSEVELTVISSNVCLRTFQSIIVSDTICTSGDNRRSTCPGDSGGPLVVTRSGRRILIGVILYFSPQGCTRNQPVANLRVTSFIPWIEEHL